MEHSKSGYFLRGQVEQVLTTIESTILAYSPAYSIPVLVGIGSFILSRVFRLNLSSVLFAAGAPFLLLYFDLPLADWYRDLHPLRIVAIGWGAIAALSLGWILARSSMRVFDSGSGGSVVLGALTLACLAFVSLCMFWPGAIETVLPTWKSSLAMVLFIFALLSFLLRLLSFTRAGIVTFLWGALCLCLATETTLWRLSDDILADSIKELRPLLPDEVIPNKLLEKLAFNSDKTLNVALIDSLPAGTQIAQGLEQDLNGFSTVKKAEVLRAGGADLSIFQLERVVETVLASSKPDVLVLSGWQNDASQSMNAYRLPGLSESEAVSRAARSEFLASLPFYRSIVESRLYASLTRFLGGDSAVVPESDAPIRVGPTEYQEKLQSIAQRASAAGVDLVLAHAPASTAMAGDAYRTAMKVVSKNAAVHFVDVEKEFTDRPYDNLYQSAQLLTPTGRQAFVASLLPAILESDSIASTADRDYFAMLKQFPRREQRFLANTKNIDQDVLFALNFPERNSYYAVSFSINGEYIDSKRLNEKESVDVRFAIPEKFRTLPYTELSMRIAPSPSKAMFGNSGISAPIPFFVSSHPKERSAVVIGTEDILPHDQPPELFLAAIHQKSGQVLETLAVREPDTEAEMMSSFIRRQVWGTAVSVVRAGSRPFSADASLKKAFEYIGIQQVPESADAYAAVGLAGVGSSGALVHIGDEHAELSLFDERFEPLSHFRVDNIYTTNRTLAVVRAG